MVIKKIHPTHIFVYHLGPFLAAFLLAILLVQPARAKQQPYLLKANSLSTASSVSADPPDATHDSTVGGTLDIPVGTILPIRLNSTISTAKSKPGELITGRIMQDVPLPQSGKIRAGSKLIGHIVEVTPAMGNVNARISLQFDKLISSNQTLSLTTNLRAIAGFMDVAEAKIPPIGPGEGDVYGWLTTVQIGGDVVYGHGGMVYSPGYSNGAVGKSVDGGVLAHVTAGQGTSCRGPIDGNDSPQALWVFSSNACGTYGLPHVNISHFGRNNPVGVIELSSDTSKVDVPSGAGMLLRVDTVEK